MNGICFKSYAAFQEKWKLVTVRFRTDTGEQRFTYANPAAYKVLIAGKIDYPDGAVFAKIGIMTREDPDFTSSKVPGGAKRIQFMVHNAARYASTGGWGYALFDPHGKQLVADPPDEQARACDACHQAVKHRGYVFSQPMNLSSGDGAGMTGALFDTAIPEGTGPASHLTFVDRGVSDLPVTLSAQLPPGMHSVRFLESSIREHVFNGTLDEIRPTLIKEAVRAKLPAVLLSKDERLYILVYHAAYEDGTSCPKGEWTMKAYRTVPVEKSGSASNIQNTTDRTCFKL